MKTIISILYFLLCFVNGYSQFLKTKNHDIVNEYEEPVILRGMGLGGWMLQEGYMFKLSNTGQQYRIKEKIAEVIGKEQTDLFYDQWLQNHTTKKDIDSMAAWGFNSVRLPMHYNLFTLPVDEEPVPGNNTWLEKGFTVTDSLLSWCRANKMYLILDLHAAPGGQGNDLPISDRDPSKPALWESAANRQKTIALWRKIAERYAHEAWIGGYDILNEPNYGFEDPVNDFRGLAENKNEPLKQLMVEITKAIREVDKKHIIIIEGNGFGNNYRGILPQWDDNMVLSFHKYGNFNSYEEIKTYINLRDRHNIPLWLGESGENSNTWFTEAIQLAEENGIGWAWWQLKKMGINNPLQIKAPKGYEKLLAYWSGKGEKPAVSEARSILEELISNLKIENNTYHPDVIDAMFRQVKSQSTKPFKEHHIQNFTTVEAEDFDLGRQRAAYFDRDSARYQYTPGVNTEGNKGYTYRNDGVDITSSENKTYVFSIEAGEWLTYTVNVETTSRYDISFITALAKGSAAISIYKDDSILMQELAVPVTGSLEKWKTTTMHDVLLTRGSHTFRLLANSGGFNFDAIQFKKTK